MQKPTVCRHHVNGRLCYWLHSAQAPIVRAKLHRPRWPSSIDEIRACSFLRFRQDFHADQKSRPLL